MAIQMPSHKLMQNKKVLQKASTGVLSQDPSIWMYVTITTNATKYKAKRITKRTNFSLMDQLAGKQKQPRRLKYTARGMYQASRNPWRVSRVTWKPISHDSLDIENIDRLWT